MDDFSSTITKGRFKSLQGEQTVTSAVIALGVVAFSSPADSSSQGTCSAQLDGN
jgi:hypothetical protein